ncbi:LysM peptidoglycan-binding domain-containing protein [Streptomyces violaceusniger]|uniref:Peptidoglycan-binding lysin domain-containing protein n=1 Tax=Streptomyces violaceusniger (strain Tu 4113) TaxID=653045 RepID=G2PGZ0_STRV4|nr:LysM peptidoglycan-binding domain-containing protein [Streptomyces violaceusniger]AEM88704.1 Peptidoglycan-binding lysin domain-containing protein [Streptomyces violaceusniger Tu 4113]
MAHRSPGPLRGIGVLLRALIGLAVLAALIAGVPYLLLIVGHQPTELSGGLDMLMRPDDDSLFLVVLTCLGWIGWAAFTLSVLVEATAVLRRRSAPRIKGLGGLQSLAGLLISGIVLLAPTAASAATAPAHAATATQTAAGTTPSSTASTSPASPGGETDWPRHTVTSPREELWDLAEEYLGSGPRWKDIAALNPEFPELASGDAKLHPGMVLKLPADARQAEPASSPAPDATRSTTTAPEETPSPETQAHTGEAARSSADESAHAGAPDDSENDAERPPSVTVHDGDSLWSIAGQHGDPAEWPALYKANQDQLTDPDLIYPGQQLDLPQAHTPRKGPADPPDTGKTPPRGERKQDATPPDQDHHEGQDGGQQEAPPATTAPAPSPSHTAEPSPAPSRTRDATPAPSPTAQDTSPDQAEAHQSSEESQQTLAPAAVWAGAGILAAALVSTLATRRVLQQRRRRPGRRIPMPQGSAASTEQSLRAVQHPTGFDLLDTALRTLALRLAAQSRDLPVLTAVVLHETRIELHLAEETAPCAPFTTTADRQDVWTCTASSSGLASPEDLQAADAPYPALVTLGWDPQGRLVLVDLEHVGVLNLAGDEHLARHVLQAIAVELATTSLPGHLEVTALGTTVPGLDAAAPERVARTDDLADATAHLAAHTADQRRALAALGAHSLGDARLRDDAGGSWTSHIILAQALPEDADETAVAALFNALTMRPRTAGAVITAAPAGTPLPADTWTLTCQGPDETIVLPGSGLSVHLQGLSDEHFADAIELLTIAGSDTDVPAPAWTRTADNEDLGGMPAEYAELEQDNLDKEPPNEAATGESPVPAPRETESQEPEPAGLSLADVLAEDDDPDDGRTAKPTPAPDPAGIPRIIAPQPCATPAPAVHATIPAPEPEATTPEPGTATGPAVQLLGPISIEGATGRVDSNRRRTGTELAAFLALNPGVDHHAIDEALWPGQIVNKTMRNSVISRLRSWLSTDDDGKAHFPRVQDTGDHRYRLGPHVTCDWTQFQQHARKGLHNTTEDGDLALCQALALVRGRPFTAIDPQRYAWAEPAIQEMVSAIVDVAYELSTRRREANDVPGALWAARQGLLAAEENELLHRALFLAHHAACDIDALRKAAAHLARVNEQLGGGVDMDAETAELLRNLLPRTVVRAR